MHNAARLEEGGISLRYGKHFDSPGSPWVPPADRAADIHDLATTPGIDFLVGTWGGSACSQLLPFLDWNMLRTAGRPVIGDSDIGVLVNNVAMRAGVPSFLGRGLGTMDEINDWVSDWVNPLVRGDQATITKGQGCLQPGNRVAQGVLLGGDIRSVVLAGLDRTLEDARECILILESPDQPDQALQLLLHLFSRSSVRNSINGLVLGRTEFTSAHHSVLADLLGPSTPIVLGAPFGHGRGACVTVPIGREATLAISVGGWYLKS